MNPFEGDHLPRPRSQKDIPLGPETAPPQVEANEAFEGVRAAAKKGGGAGGSGSETGKKTGAEKKKTPADYRKIIEEAMKKNSQVKEVFETTPIANAAVEEFIAKGFEQKKSLEQIAREIRQAVIEGKTFGQQGTLEATYWLTTVALKTNTPDLIVPVGGGSHNFTIFQKDELPDFTVPAKPEGKKPDEAKMKEWEQKTSEQKRRQRLKDELDVADQAIKATPTSRSEDTLKRLERLTTSLIEGKKSAERFDKATGKSKAEASYFDPKDAQVYIDRITVFREQLQAEQTAERTKKDIERNISQEERSKRIKTERESDYDTRKKEKEVEAVETGQLVLKSSELAANFNNRPELASGRPIEVSRNIDRWELDLLLQGKEGAERWKAKFRREKMGAPNTAFKMELPDQSKWEAVKNLLRELHGPIEGPELIKEFQIDFDMFEQVDGGLKYAETGIKGVKTEEQTKALKFTRNEEAERLTKYPLFDLAKVHFTESLKYTITDNIGAKYHESLRFLQGNDALQINGRNVETSRVEIWRELKRRRDNNISLTDAETSNFQRLEEHVSTVSEGIMLRDEYMIPESSTAYNSLRESQKKYLENEQLLQQNTLSLEQRQTLQEEQQKLLKVSKDAFLEYVKNDKYEFDIHDVDTVLAINTLSPIQIEARRRIITSLLQEGKTPEQIQSIEWKIYESLWAAKAYSVTQGEAMEIGAKMARAPARDLRWILKFKPEEIPSFATMNRGYAEAYQRLLNPALFADDFSFGGKLGDDVRNLHYSIIFRMAGYNFHKDKNVDQEWKDKARARAKEGVPEWVVISEYAEQILGFTFSETIRPEILVTGLNQLSSPWRQEKSALSPLREQYLRAENLPPGADPYLQGLGFRFNGANKEYKMTILHQMLQRKASSFFDLIGADLDLTNVKHGGIEFGSSEWQLFRRSLGTAEVQMWRDDRFKYNKSFDFIDVAKRNTDFDPIMKRAIESNGGVATPEVLDKFFSVMTEMKKHMETKTANGKTRLENWGEHKFANNYVLTNTDFDWSKVDPKSLNYFSFERRINDLNNQGRARDLMNEVKFKTEYLSPIKGKETDTINKIKEHRDAINSYSTLDNGELSAASLMELVVEWNRLRAINSKAFPITFIPGGISLLKRFGGLEMLTDIIGNIKAGEGGKLKNKEWFKKIEEWPRSIGQAVSYDVKWSGREGNAWDEYRVAGFFASAETAKLFVNKPDLLRAMKKKYHTGFLYRWFYGVPRKYWWVVPVATIAVSASQAVEDEKKKN